ncbi:MAG TPA: hypothetical protein VIX59_14295 [Candidatus Binataceae bacterium]
MTRLDRLADITIDNKLTEQSGFRGAKTAKTAAMIAIRTTKREVGFMKLNAGFITCLVVLVAFSIALIAGRAASAADPPCGKGQMWVYTDHGKGCMQIPPGSQADCPPGYTFVQMSEGAGCSNLLDTRRSVPAGEPPADTCQNDSDCSSGACSADGYCDPDVSNN